MKLSCRNWLNRVPSIMKMGQDNDMIDHTCVVFDENDTKLS